MNADDDKTRAVDAASLRPRTLQFRGRVLAAALIFDRTHMGEAEAQRRLLAEWEACDRVFEIEDSLLLVFAHARVVVTHEIGAAPLVAFDGALVDVPLRDIERTTLRGQVGREKDFIAITRGGATIAHAISTLTAVDPSTWVDLGAFQLRTPPALVAPMPPQEARLVEVDLDNNAVLKAVAPPSEELSDVLERIHLRDTNQSAAKPNAKPSASSSAGGFWQRLFGGGAAAATERAAEIGDVFEPSSASQPPSSPSFFERLFGSGSGASNGATKKGAAARLRDSIARRVGKKQADYIEKMMGLFEGEDLDAALKHAIALSGSNGPTSSNVNALRGLQARSSLALSRYSGLGTHIVDSGPNLYQQLEDLYRAAYRRLIDAGDIDKGAFVLLELLGDVDAAVTLLAKHKRFREAAEIAEGRGLIFTRAAELWARAGDVERAILLARRHGNFSAIAVALDASDPKTAERFRLLWAHTCAVAGDYEAAIVALGRQLGARRQLAQKWMERGAGVGGAMGARLLAHRLSEEFDADTAFIEMACDLIDSDIEGASLIRLAFAEELVSYIGPSIDVVIDRLTRALVHDAVTAPQRIPKNTLHAIAKRSCGLWADLPPLSAPVTTSLLSREWPLVAEIDVRDMGSAAAHDVISLPRGRLLVAHGVAGVHVVDERTGGIKRRFNVPAVAVVPSIHGDRALALSARSGRVRVWMLDLNSGATAAWIDLDIEAYAETYDGKSWAVAADDEVKFLDVLDDAGRVIWRVDGIMGPVDAIFFSATEFSFFERGRAQLWRYDMPSLTLRSRAGQTQFEINRRVIALAKGGLLISSNDVDGGNSNISVGRSDFLTPIKLDADAIVVAPCAISQADLVAIPVLDLGGASIRVHAVQTGVEVVHLRLEGATLPKVRASGDDFLIFDDRGRVVRLRAQGSPLGRTLLLHGI